MRVIVFENLAPAPKGLFPVNTSILVLIPAQIYNCFTSNRN